MNIRTNFLRVTFSFFIVVVLVFGAFADTIRLKDGSIIKGRITGFSGGKFTITIGEGTRRKEFSYGANEIESIEFDRDYTASQPVAAVNRKVSTDSEIPDEKPQPIAPKVITTDTTVKTTANIPIVVNKPTSTYAKPIEVNVKVLADNTANGWTNSGWVVKKGQRIKIIGDGEVSLGRGQKTGPSGLSELEDEKKLLRAVPTGALIAVIGDDNNDFIYIGSEREFTATRDGALFLGVNEGNLNDNSGSFQVRIEISPNTSE